MKENAAQAVDLLLEYQGDRLKSLMEEILQCCKERTSYLSSKFVIPEAELRCLMLFGEERYLTSKGISQRLEVAKSRVTKILTGLMDKGLVESVDDPKDARVKLISLTAAGQRKSKELTATVKALHQKLLLEFEAEQRKNILSCLDVLRSGMEAVKKQLI